MNIDTFLKVFVPKDHSFYPLFEKDAHNLISAAEQLVLLMKTDDPDKRDSCIKRIKELESIGDEITDSTYEQLNKSFITPFDREDIHELASNIDDILDSINGISRRITLYKPKKILPVYKELANIILISAREIGTCIDNLRDAVSNRKIIMQACDNIYDLEHKADDLYYLGISELFIQENNEIELIKTKELLEILERCVDEADDVSETIKGILIKMA
jgi:predicted phosphate transport protein (TIGR00153 family)